MQNEEYTRVLSFIITMCMVYMFFSSMKNSIKLNKSIDLSKINLFTIYPNDVAVSRPEIIASASLELEEKKETNNKDKQTKDRTGEYTDLQMDCIAALKSLGIKTKKEQKFLVNNIFNKHNPKTVEEFIKLAFAR